MKIMKKGLVLLLALVLAMGFMLSMAPEADAAATTIAMLAPGESTTIEIPYSDAWGVNGSISISDSSVVKISIDTSKSNMVGLAGNDQFFFYTQDPQGATGKIVITLTMPSNTPEGASTTVEVRYAITPMGSETPGETQIKSTFIIAYVAVEPEPLPPNVVALDNSALVAQLRRAFTLVPSDYTLESWNVVETALQAGFGALNSGSQSQINAAASALSYAINTLVPMDYSDLQSVLDDLGQLEELEDISQQWARFTAAVENANAAMTSSDPVAVEAAVAELLLSKEELLAALADLRQIVEVEKEVEVIVEKIVEKVVTETVYVEEVIECDKWTHKLYLIVMIISLVINAGLATLIIIHLVKKRRAQKDKTPLVEYNIEDDGAPNQ